jgi:hypothetical protein
MMTDTVVQEVEERMTNMLTNFEVSPLPRV